MCFINESILNRHKEDFVFSMACICIINILNKNLGPFNDSKLDDTAVLAFQQDDCENGILFVYY